MEKSQYFPVPKGKPYQRKFVKKSGKLLSAEDEDQSSAGNINVKRPNILKMKSYKHDGLYVKVEIYQQNVHCLVDTEASMSVLHSKIFKNLPPHNKNKIQPYQNELRMADGRSVTPVGIIKLPILLDNQIILQSFFVAEIDTPVILGYDFMFETNV